MIDNLETYGFLASVLDSVTDSVVVIDKQGRIVFVNKSWVDFSNEGGLKEYTWEGVDYLGACDDAAKSGDDSARQAVDGIRSVLAHELEVFYFEYPCHIPEKKRWFMMKVTHLKFLDRAYCAITHQNITRVKLAEEKAVYLSGIDGLTSIPNRRYLDQFMNAEWARCRELSMPLSLAIIDVDSFKSFNDTYGHIVADEILVRISSALAKLTVRPGDLCARYGGDEFLLVFSNMNLEQSSLICKQLLKDVRSLDIEHSNSTVVSPTVSIGLAMVYPDNEYNEHDLIKAADKQLYSAKHNGGNQLVC